MSSKASLASIDHEVLRRLHGDRSSGSAGLRRDATTPAATKLETLRVITYAIGGQAYNKGITANIDITAGPAQAAGTTKLYLVSINAAGTILTTPGEVDVTDSLPDLPANNAPIGAFKVVTAGVATFTPGTTALNAADVTTTYADLNVMPVGVPTFA